MKYFLLLILFIPSLAYPQATTSSKGELRLESRFFNNDNNSATQDFGYGLAGRLEVENSFNALQTRMQVFSRVDYKDPSRQRLNLEELYSQYLFEDWSLFAGYKTINWSTNEAFQPIDVINSRNFDGPFENAEKIGELMAGFEYLSEYLNFTGFFMPSVVRPQLPASNNRLSFNPPGISVGEVHFVDNEGRWVNPADGVSQWALRAQIPMNSLEVNFYWLHHFNRTDFQILNNGSQFIPILSEVDQFSFSLQWLWESWIFKTENVYRNFKENIFIPAYGQTLTRNDYGLTSFALEYLWSHQTGSDTTILFEFQELIGVQKNLRFNINPFQRDALLGMRHAFNDINGREFFVGIIADLERTRELMVSASYSQRLSDVWKIKLSSRYIDAQPSGPMDVTGMRVLNNDHQVEINLSRFF